MSNPEKNPQNQFPGHHQGGLLPTADSQQYPQHQQDSGAPPAYHQGQAELPGDEKPRPQESQMHSNPTDKQQFVPAAVQQQQQNFHSSEPQQFSQDSKSHGVGGVGAGAGVGEGVGMGQNFPPPPPGPPPVQQHHQQSAPHPNPLSQNPLNQNSLNQNTSQQFQQEQGQGQQDYSIPQYNPANPVFAPPPTSETQTGTGAGHAANVNAATGPAVGHTPGQTAGHVPEHSTVHGQSTMPGQSTIPGQSTAAPVEHKKGWSERFTQLGIKAAAPINSLAHKFGSQSFLPETLDKECDKAASILRTFCKKGVYADPGADQLPTSTDPKAKESNDAIIDPTKEKPKNRVLVTIPPKVIAKAAGLAIFTTLRAGFNVSGATGSGILIARLPDGTWGPPSGIQIHSVGGGFLVGLDIYDCVCVINSQEALAAFTNTRVGLGSDLAVVAGPYGAGGAVEFGAAMDNREDRKTKDARREGEVPGEVPTQAGAENQGLKPEKDPKAKRRSLSANKLKPVFSYVKSRGFYAGVQVDGTVVVERKDANAAFYGERVPVEKIIRGQVPVQGPIGMWPTGARYLHDTLRGAEAGALLAKDGKDPVTPTKSGFEGHGHDPSAPVASGGLGTQGTTAGGSGPPAYVDDGLVKPGVGDYKYR